MLSHAGAALFSSSPGFGFEIPRLAMAQEGAG
jgi:hypothetical protein